MPSILFDTLGGEISLNVTAANMVEARQCYDVAYDCLALSGGSSCTVDGIQCVVDYYGQVTCINRVNNDYNLLYCAVNSNEEAFCDYLD